MIKLLINKVNSLLSTNHPRSREAKNNIILALSFKGLSVLISFLLVPITLHYLDNEKYGIWITLSSIVGWLTLFDMGLGNGLRNKLAEALAKGNNSLAKEYVSTAYATIGAISLLVLILFLFANQYIDWVKILNASPNLSNEIKAVVSVVFVLFCIQLILNLISQISNATQKPAINNLINLTYNVISFIGIFILVEYNHEGSLVYLGIISMGAPILVYLIFTFFLFKSKFKYLQISIKNIKSKHIKSLTSLGILFFMTQLTYIFNYSVSNFLITQFIGPASVTEYNIVFRYYGIVTMIYTIIITPFWSGFTDAFFRKDYIWIKSVIRKLNYLFICISLLLFMMTIVSKHVYYLWVGKDIIPSYLISGAMGFYVLTLTFVTPYLYFLNGINKVKEVLLISIITMLVNIGVVYISINIFNLNILGAILGPITSNMILVIVVPKLYFKYIKDITN